MLTLADYNFPPFEEANLPKRIEPPALDLSSFDAYRRTQKARSGVAFPEAELRYSFERETGWFAGAVLAVADGPPGDHHGRPQQTGPRPRPCAGARHL